MALEERNPEVDYLIDELKLHGSLEALDGSEKENRRYGWLILQKYKDFNEAKEIIKVAGQDDFHRRNATSLKYIFYNYQKIKRIATDFIDAVVGKDEKKEEKDDIVTSEEVKDLNQSLQEIKSRPLYYPLEYYGMPIKTINAVSGQPEIKLQDQAVLNPILGLVDASLVDYCLENHIIIRFEDKNEVHWKVVFPEYLSFKEKLKALRLQGN